MDLILIYRPTNISYVSKVAATVHNLILTSKLLLDEDLEQVLEFEADIPENDTFFASCMSVLSCSAVALGAFALKRFNSYEIPCLVVVSGSVYLARRFYHLYKEDQYTNLFKIMLTSFSDLTKFNNTIANYMKLRDQQGTLTANDPFNVVNKDLIDFVKTLLLIEFEVFDSIKRGIIYISDLFPELAQIIVDCPKVETNFQSIPDILMSMKIYEAVQLLYQSNFLKLMAILCSRNVYTEYVNDLLYVLDTIVPDIVNNIRRYLQIVSKSYTSLSTPKLMSPARNVTNEKKFCVELKLKQFIIKSSQSISIIAEKYSGLLSALEESNQAEDVEKLEPFLIDLKEQTKQICDNLEGLLMLISAVNKRKQVPLKLVKKENKEEEQEDSNIPNVTIKFNDDPENDEVYEMVMGGDQSEAPSIPINGEEDDSFVVLPLMVNEIHRALKQNEYFKKRQERFGTEVPNIEESASSSEIENLSDDIKEAELQSNAQGDPTGSSLPPPIPPPLPGSVTSPVLPLPPPLPMTVTTEDPEVACKMALQDLIKSVQAAHFQRTEEEFCSEDLE